MITTITSHESSDEEVLLSYSDFTKLYSRDIFLWIEKTYPDRNIDEEFDKCPVREFIDVCKKRNVKFKVSIQNSIIAAMSNGYCRVKKIYAPVVNLDTLSEEVSSISRSLAREIGIDYDSDIVFIEPV